MGLGKSLYVAVTRNRRLPKVVPPMHEMVSLVAQLGGYLNRRSDPPPGPKALWKGVTQLRDYADAWDAFGPEAQTNQGVFVKKTYG